MFFWKALQNAESSNVPIVKAAGELCEKRTQKIARFTCFPQKYILYWALLQAGVSLTVTNNGTHPGKEEFYGHASRGHSDYMVLWHEPEKPFSMFFHTLMAQILPVQGRKEMFSLIPMRIYYARWNTTDGKKYWYDNSNSCSLHSFRMS